MIKGWVKIYTSTDFFKSELVRQVLIDNEINAVILDKQGSPYKVLGYVEVYVQEVNENRAFEIITTNEL